MAWLKASDTAATDERVLTVAELEDADERSVNEVFGFVTRLYLQAAQHGTDYQATLGTAMLLSPRYELLLDQAARAGLLSVGVEEGRRFVRLLVDGDFLHLRTKEEQQWEKDRKADTSDPRLTVPVRRRDGDACRYCGKVVNWADRKGNRGGTYDHLVPGQRAQNHHELVVACIECNGGRGDGSKGREARYPLKPAPEDGQQYYSQSTIRWLQQHGTILTELDLTVPKRTRGAKDLKAGTQTRPDVQPLAGGTRPAGPAATAPSGDQRPAQSQTRPDDAATAPSGDQRSGPARDMDDEADYAWHLRAPDASEAPADAAPHPSGDQRAERTSEAPEADAGHDQVGPEVAENSAVNRENASGRSDLDAEGAGSGFPGSGRVGTGRDGTGRAGTGRDGRAQRRPGSRRRSVDEGGGASDEDGSGPAGESATADGEPAGGCCGGAASVAEAEDRWSLVWGCGLGGASERGRPGLGAGDPCGARAVVRPGR